MSSSASPSTQNNRPDFYPLPQKGPDAFFGLCRSSYYDLERRGLLRLVRIKKPGNVRGRVLIPYAKMAALIKERWSGIEATRSDGQQVAGIL